MASVSKESVAQFWLHAFPLSSVEQQSFSVTDVTLVPRLLDFLSTTDDEKKIFDRIETLLRETQPRRPVSTKTTSPKRRRSAKNVFGSLRFTVNVEVIDDIEGEEEVPSNVEDRTIDHLAAILLESDVKKVSQHCQSLIYPWLVDLSFHVSPDLYGVLVELMNHFPEPFFRHCFIPWLQRPSIDHFFSNLFTRISKPSARNQLCTSLCQNSTSPWNDNELTLISHWLDSKEFYFASDLFEDLPEKCAVSAPNYPDSLPFAKVLHKVLIKSSEHNQILSVEQRSALKQAILVNTTILSDILLDLLD